MSHESVSCRETSPISGADDESLSSVESGCWWENAHEITHEAETNRASVEAWRVSSSTVPASTFVDLCVVTDAEVVADVSPAVGVHVEVLDVSHLSIASSLGCATSTSGVMDDEVSWWLSCEPSWVSSASSPLSSGTNVGTWTSLGV